jgi:hypothetical protein
VTFWSLELHPLALEDVLHATPSKRSKVDYYTKHLFLRILCHSVPRDGEVTLINAPVFDLHPHTTTDFPRSDSPDPFVDKDYQGLREIVGNGGDKSMMIDSSNSTPKKGFRARFFGDLEKGPHEKKRNLLKSGLRRLAVSCMICRSECGKLISSLFQAREALVREEITIEELKKGDRVNIKVEPMFIFLTRGGMCR